MRRRRRGAALAALLLAVAGCIDPLTPPDGRRPIGPIDAAEAVGAVGRAAEPRLGADGILLIRDLSDRILPAQEEELRAALRPELWRLLTAVETEDAAEFRRALGAAMDALDGYARRTDHAYLPDVAAILLTLESLESGGVAVGRSPHGASRR